MTGDKPTPDIQWLLNNLPDATEDEQDDFAERVAVCVHDGKLFEDAARKLSLFRIKCSRRG